MRYKQIHWQRPIWAMATALCKLLTPSLHGRNRNSSSGLRSRPLLCSPFERASASWCPRHVQERSCSLRYGLNSETQCTYLRNTFYLPVDLPTERFHGRKLLPTTSLHSSPSDIPFHWANEALGGRPTCLRPLSPNGDITPVSGVQVSSQRCSSKLGTCIPGHY
ncbi:hypothetical protein EDB87DRAFT_627759 [Lactarius vividus]|nr:hypothetical protein EDB87DRAFT_627759 [Lactarius vividus]